YSLRSPDLPAFPTRRSSDLIWGALLLAQVFHGLQVQLAAQEGVDPFDVSLDVLVEVAPRLLQRGIAPLPFLGRVGREVGLIRPRDRKSTRLNSSHQIISYAV